MSSPFLPSFNAFIPPSLHSSFIHSIIQLYISSFNHSFLPLYLHFLIPCIPSFFPPFLHFFLH
jgi:hypothetical protein